MNKPKTNLLGLNLQFFNDGGESPIDLGDEELNQQYAEFEKEWNEQEQQEEEETTSTDDEQEQQEEETTSTDDEQQQDHKTNEAFKRMREELEEKSKYAKVIEEIAKQYGVSPEKIIERFEQQKLEQQAKEQNVPVDVLQRMNKIEQENQQLREEMHSKEFNAEVEAAKEKYELSEQEIKETIDFMGKKNFPVGFSFEDAYKLQNHDKIVEQEKEKAQQEYLENKKKRQEKSDQVDTKGQSPKTSSNEVLTDDEYKSILKDMDIPNL